ADLAPSGVAGPVRLDQLAPQVGIGLLQLVAGGLPAVRGRARSHHDVDHPAILRENIRFLVPRTVESPAWAVTSGRLMLQPSAGSSPGRSGCIGCSNPPGYSRRRPGGSTPTRGCGRTRPGSGWSG